MKDQINSGTDNRDTDNKSQNGISNIPLTEGTESNKHSNQTANKINENSQPEKKWIVCLKRPVTDWMLAVATLLIGITAIFQCQILQETNQTSQVRDKAYLYFADPEIFPYPPKGEPVTTGVSIVAVNLGNIPGRLISIRCGWIDGKDNAVDQFPLAKLSAVNVVNFIGPRQGMKLQGCEIPPDIYRKAKEMKVNIFVLMEVKYTDSFDNKRIRITRTSRSLRFDIHGGKSWGFAYNCTDEDCK